MLYHFEIAKPASIFNSFLPLFVITLLVRGKESFRRKSSYLYLSMERDHRFGQLIQISGVASP